MRANSRRVGDCSASPAPLGVHRPTRASRGGAESVENGEGAEDAVELAKLDRKSPLARARPRVPAKTRLTHLQWRARAWERPPNALARALSFGDDVDRLERLRRDRGAGPERPALDIMLRHLKKFAVYSSVIVAGQASRALDNAPFAGQDESEDAKGLLRQLTECVQIFGECYDPDETTTLRVPPASPTPGAARDRPSAS